jgi:hypothetical protein
MTRLMRMSASKFQESTPTSQAAPYETHRIAVGAIRASGQARQPGRCRAS